MIFSKSYRGKFKDSHIVTFRLHGFQKRFRAMVLTQAGETPEQVVRERSPFIVLDFEIEESEA